MSYIVNLTQNNLNILLAYTSSIVYLNYKYIYQKDIPKSSQNYTDVRWEDAP